MTQDMGQGDNRRWNFTPDDFEVGLANAAGLNLQKDLILAQNGALSFNESERLVVGFKH